MTINTYQILKRLQEDVWNVSILPIIIKKCNIAGYNESQLQHIIDINFTEFKETFTDIYTEDMITLEANNKEEYIMETECMYYNVRLIDDPKIKNLYNIFRDWSNNIKLKMVSSK